jgi:hypothetical protein
MKLDAGIRHWRYFWKYVFVGVAIIFGFWMTWHPLWMLLGIIDFFKTGALGGGVPLQSIHDTWRDMLYLIAAGVTVTMSVLAWRGATRAKVVDGAFLNSKVGATVYAVAAAIILGTAGEVAHVMSWLYTLDPQDTHDRRLASYNAATRLERDPSLPLIGFWQTKCESHGGGIAIQRETRWLKLYRLDFCSDFGCGLRNYSKIVDDPAFRVIDPNTIEFEPSSANIERMIYHRCG